MPPQRLLPVFQDLEGQARPSPPLASLRPMAQPHYSLSAPPPGSPRPSPPLAQLWPMASCHLNGPAHPWHTREGRGGAEGPRGRFGASAGRGVPGPPRGRLEGDSRRKQPRLGRQDQARGPRSGTLREQTLGFPTKVSVQAPQFLVCLSRERRLSVEPQRC